MSLLFLLSFFTVGPCRLSILNIAVCRWQSQTPSLALPLPPAGNPGNKLILSVSLFCKLVHSYHFFFLTFYFVLG